MKKLQTELRVYFSAERLRYDFRKIVESINIDIDGLKIIPNREIFVPKSIRIIFKVDDGRIRGYRPDKVFIDEMVSNETKEYLELVTSQNDSFTK